MSRRRTLLLGLAVLSISFAGLFSFYSAQGALYGNDAYYHLAVARAVAADGAEGLRPPLRRSALADGGDKELLFHALLAPFAALPDPLLGGRLALALLGALVVTAIALLAVRAIGLWGLLVPPWLLFTSTEVDWRLVRLRPELLSLLLLLAATWAVAGRRYRLLGVIAGLYALSYTAIHVFLGLCGLWFLCFGIIRRRWDPALLLYPALGAGIGLLIHPHFPANLEIWSLQNVAYFLHKGNLVVGNEIRPNFTDVALLVNLGWILGLIVLWRSARPPLTSDSALTPTFDDAAEAVAEERDDASTRRDSTRRARSVSSHARSASRSAHEEDARLADAFAIGATLWSALYLLMSRFSIYAFPFLTLWLLFELRRRGRLPSRWLGLPGGQRLPSALAWALCILLALPEAGRQLANYRARTELGPDEARWQHRRDMAAALPEGARVFASWGQTSLYVFWAPHAQFLNALDPIFMAVPHPREFAAYRAVLAGHEPDVPAAVDGILDSEYLVLPVARGERMLRRRLAADPRVEKVFERSDAIYRLRPDGIDAFVRDWRAAPPGPAIDATDPAAWPPYPWPRATDPGGSELAAFIEATPFAAADGCARFARPFDLDVDTTVDWELAPSGPSRLFLDGDLVADMGGSPGAVLGHGLRFRRELAAGAHQLVVHTCRPPTGTPRAGFYLVDRLSNDG